MLMAVGVAEPHFDVACVADRRFDAHRGRSRGARNERCSSRTSIGASGLRLRLGLLVEDLVERSDQLADRMRPAIGFCRLGRQRYRIDGVGNLGQGCAIKAGDWQPQAAVIEGPTVRVAIVHERVAAAARPLLIALALMWGVDGSAEIR